MNVPLDADLPFYGREGSEDFGGYEGWVQGLREVGCGADVVGQCSRHRVGNRCRARKD